MAKKEKPVHVPVLRSELKLKDDDIIPQTGMQEATLLSDANVTFIGGNRGGGKSYVLVLDPCYDISNGNFNAMMIRKETDQLKKGGGLYDKASKIYEYLGAKGTNLKFKFPSGAVITYEHIQNENPIEVDKRFKGLEIPAIYVDEIDQFMFNTFLKLLQSNRNSSGIRNRILGTCNPNKNSWLRKFLDWYISEYGTIDPLKDRQIRYFYVYGKTVNDIFWGDTKESVYDLAKYYIDRLWNPKFEDSGLSKMDMIKSFKFIKGDLAENPILLKNDPSYIGSISMGGIEATARNIEGNWDTAEDGEEMVTSEDMAMMFDPFRTPATNGVKYLSIDVALQGLDRFVATLWDGDHIEDIFVKDKLDADEAKLFVKSIASEYGVREDNICYDNVGNGQVLTCLKRAFPINAMANPVGTEVAYFNLKSQILYDFGRALIEGKITCSQRAANKEFNYGSGSKKQKIKYSEILQTERRALKQVESAGKTKMLNKPEMKKILGGISPDFIESVAYKRVFNLQKKKVGGFKGLEYL